MDLVAGYAFDWYLVDPRMHLKGEIEMKIAYPLFPGFVCLLLLAFVLTAGALQTSGLRSDETSAKTDPRRRPATEPQYNDKGELKRPTDYQTWVFVGSNLGLEYSDDPSKEPPQKDRDKKAAIGNFHNVYINPEAYAQYAKTGKFPEKTVLVLDIFKSEVREPRNIVSEGLFPGQQSGLAVAVKNSARPDGSKTDWAYYDFPNDQSAARAFPDKACYDCHLEHADDDNVWVQFYPTLRKHREIKAKKTNLPSWFLAQSEINGRMPQKRNLSLPRREVC